MNRTRWQHRLHAIWYGDSRAYLILVPLSWLYCALVGLRRFAYRLGVLRTTRLNARVVIIGNISVGGSGKTPLTVAVTERLKQAGYSVGILTRGYLGAAQSWPQAVNADSDPQQVGDEAVLLARKTGVPVYAGPNRVEAGRALLQASPCDVIVCDDGLQHYALQRDLEVVMLDAARGHGNGRCLPAGPLREPASRLQQFDARVVLGGNAENTYAMQLTPGRVYRLTDPADTRELAAFRNEAVHAVAGIANPDAFFTSLRQAGLKPDTHAFADHHGFNATDLAFNDNKPVLMTEKDALKCIGFAQPDWWCVPVETRVDEAFFNWLIQSIPRMEH